MTGKNICNLCCPCGIIFSIKKDIYKTAVIYVKHIRWGETTVYGQLTWPRQIDLPVTSAVTHNPATDNDIKILPNPVKDKLFVNLKEERKVSFKIYSLQGGLLLDTEITGSQYTDVSFLNSGLYFVVIDNKYVNKLIKE